MTYRRCILVVLFVTGSVLRAPAQSQSCVNRSITAQIYSKNGNPVTTLRATDFKLRIGRKGVPVRLVAYDSAPRRVVLLVDVSGRMVMSGDEARALAFARDMITLAPPGDSLALLAFSERTDAQVDFGSSRAALTGAAYALQQTRWRPGMGRSAAVEDALVNALILMKKSQPGDAICLITEGNDTASHIRRASVRKLLESDGVRVFALVLPWSPQRRGGGQSVMNPRTIRSSGSARTNASLPQSVVAPRARFGLTFPPVGVSRMQDLATDTGGDFVSFVSEPVVLGPGRVKRISNGGPDDLARAAQAFLREISSFENLEFTLPAPLAQTRSVRLEVIAPSGRREKKLHLVYPHQLAPCK